VDETQALAIGTTSKCPEVSLPLPEEEVWDKAKNIDAYAVNFDPRLMALSMRYEYWSSTFNALITKYVNLGLFQGNIISKGLGALRAGFLLSSW